MEKINIAELLKDCQKGMELDCTMFENVTLDNVDINGLYPIKITTKSGYITYLTKYGQNIDNKDAKCVIFPKGKTTWEDFVPPCQFKDGDILITAHGNPFILKDIDNDKICETYCGIRQNGEFVIGSSYWTSNYNLQLATEEEKQKLFKAIKDNGYRWNADTKTFKKLIKLKFKVGDKVRHKNNHNVIFTITSITEDSYGCGVASAFWFEDQDDYELAPNKFDIAAVKPFDKVLVRDYDTQEWRISFFGRCNGLGFYKYSCINGCGYAQCIPYKNNEHLLGEKDDCDEYYKTWK